MPARFLVLPPSCPEGASPDGRAVEISDAAGEIRLGRRPDLELPLPFATLSAVHARLRREGGVWTMEDATSMNGTWVDGRRLGPGERRPIEPGAELRLADVRVRFEGDSPATAGAAAGPPDGTATIARRLVGDLFAGSHAGVPTVSVVRGAPPRRLALTELGRAYVAGRGDTCALALDVDAVSREHAAFVRGAAGVVVRDLGSKNGVVLRGARVEGERPLVDGDVVEVGPVTLVLDDPIDRYLRELAAAPERPTSSAAVELPRVSAPRDNVPPVERVPGAMRWAAVVAVVVLLLVTAVAVVFLSAN